MSKPNQDLDNRQVAKVMRAMAWGRAKGEMYSALSSFWVEYEKYLKAQKAVDDFIKEVESEGLFE